MRPVDRLPPQPWMSAATTRAVVAALTADGAEARFVGGCVRDTILGRPVRDIDIATHEPPERVTLLLQRAGIKAVPTGLKHGTVTAVVDGAHFEVTTLRRDVETYGRRAKVEFTDDWAADASRRDFTMNALFLSPDGSLYDPFAGHADLRAGRVRFVGDAATRIREDVLRLLRFFRFHAYYGAAPPDPDGLAAAAELAPLLATLSGERIAAETLKLLLAPDPAAVFELLRERGVLAHFLAEAREIARLEALVAIERAQSVEPDPIRRLAALIAGGVEAANAVAGRLRLSNKECLALAGLAEGPAPSPELDGAQRRRLLYRLGPARFRGLALIAWAGAGAAPGDGAWREVLATANRPMPVFPVQGRDALKLGVGQGPEVGRLVASVEAWWIEGDFRADREACLEKLRRLAGK